MYNELHSLPDDVPVDYQTPNVSLEKTHHSWKASSCVVGLYLFCKDSAILLRSADLSAKQ